ncbi:MAG: ABC transporter ATP-binding protein [Haliea sp.]|uniref:ABC transporter ATP-binding protein n=1 Tax=Haliea sp. TaxID=1932666 RepID=UPI0032F04411
MTADNTPATPASEEGRRVMLELRNVSHSFHARKESFEHGVHKVLDGVSLKLMEGETLGIIGRNGAGKTTMLRLMAGIFAPTSGKILRQPGSSCSLLSLGLGFQPQLSGRDNALLSSMLQGYSKREAEARLEEIREFSELGQSFDEPVKTYSAGMNARLGFTTALLTKVDILLIDEVLSVGDAEFRQKAELAMRNRIARGRTAVFVSHAEAQVKTLCSRVVWIEEGLVRAEGDPEQVLRQYRPPPPAPAPGGGSPPRP